MGWNWLKCIPLVGTALSFVECVNAALDGEGKRAFWKLAETIFEGALDAVTVASGGLTAVVTAPGRAAAKKGGKVAARVAACRVLGGVAADQFANSQSAGIIGGNSGGDNPRKPNKRECNRTNEDEEDPTLSFTTGRNGRTETLTARIFRRHLRTGQARPGRGYTTRVRNHVNSLSRIVDFRDDGTCSSDHDHVGHIIAWILGGPSDELYNFFPQSPDCNSTLYRRVEKRILKYLKKGSDQDWVWIHYEFIYRRESNRPRGIKISLEFSDGTMDETTISN